MTHQPQTTALDLIVELLAEHGFDGLAQAVTVLLNEVMKLERAAVLGAGPYQRAEGRTGYANGYKPKTVQTRVGALTLAVPQAQALWLQEAQALGARPLVMLLPDGARPAAADGPASFSDIDLANRLTGTP